MQNTKSKKSTNGQHRSGSSDDRSKTKTSRSSKASTGDRDHPQLEKFFEDSLKDIYWAEKHLTKALPKMQKAATTEELKNAIQEHTAQTEEHVSRLEQVFELLGKKAQAKKCDAMEGLIKEGDSVVEETEDGSMTRDVGIIIAAQKVEHYEIATYGGLVQLAATMGKDDVAEILSQTLEEEKETDQLLTEIAENNINWEAEMEDERQEKE
ncbi:MAG TPA: ferritin-like domain-containing protein [Chitinophagaceae bacterium]